MRLISKWAACGMALTLAVSLGLPARSDAGDEPPARPFKGSATGYITAQLPPNGLFLEMAGQATRLGHFTRQEYAYLGADGSVTGSVVFTAADGDELWVLIDGAFTSPTDVEGKYTVAGGTGRFANATGEADFQAYTPDLHYAEVTFDGWIRY